MGDEGADAAIEHASYTTAISMEGCSMEFKVGDVVRVTDAMSRDLVGQVGQSVGIHDYTTSSPYHVRTHSWSSGVSLPAKALELATGVDLPAWVKDMGVDGD